MPPKLPFAGAFDEAPPRCQAGSAWGTRLVLHGLRVVPWRSDEQASGATAVRPRLDPAGIERGTGEGGQKREGVGATRGGYQYVHVSVTIPLPYPVLPLTMPFHFHLFSRPSSLLVALASRKWMKIGQVTGARR